MEEDSEKLNLFLEEYEEIRRHLEKEFVEEARTDLYTDLITLIVKIAEYVFREVMCPLSGRQGAYRSKGGLF